MLDALEKRFALSSVIDFDHVLWGAATHDIGKMLAPSEMSHPGHDHEQIGESYMLSQGISPALARFARTHGVGDVTSLALEDILVVVADKVWKGQRHEAAEQRLTELISAHASLPAWAVYQKVDSLFERLTRDGHARLEHQSLFST